MTDKEIVNSIDVSECEFLWKEKLPKRVCNNGNLDCDCDSNLNCIFRQFKRKEQECEELREKDIKDYCKNCYVELSAIKLKIKENTHLVIKRKLINKRLCKKDREQFYALLDIITKENYNEYIICNKDEPYADKVLQTILRGEAEKI